MKKKIAAIVSAVVAVILLVVFIINGKNFFNEIDERQGMHFGERDGYVTIVGIGDCTATDIVIDSYNFDKPVTTIEAGAFNGCGDKDCTGCVKCDACANIKTFLLPDTIQNIGDGAFDGCTNLKYNYSEGVNYLGTEDNQYYALISVDKSATEATINNACKIFAGGSFDGCDNLEVINIPDSIISIPYLGSLPSLKAINVSEGNEKYSSVDGVLYNKTVSDLIMYPIGKLDVSFVIPETVTTIEEKAFSDTVNLTEITINDDLSNVGLSAFGGCTNLAKVNVSTLDAWYELNFADVLANPLNDKADLYAEGELVTELVVDKAEVKAFTFSGANITKITLEEGVTTIGASAFAGCPLVELNIAVSVSTIGESAFNGVPAEVVINYSGTTGKWALIEIGVGNPILNDIELINILG